MVSRETGWPLRTGSGLAWPDYLPWLRARQMGGRRAENGARTALFLHLEGRSQNRSKRDAHARRIQAGEDRERYTASAHGVRLRQDPRRRGPRRFPQERRRWDGANEEY